MTSAIEAVELVSHWPVPQIVAGGLRQREWPTIVQVMDQAPLFKPAGQWAAWRAFLCAAWGLPMTAEEQEIYRECTGREDVPTKRATEVDAIVGRRGGKSRVIALAAIHLATERDLSGILARGETASIPVISQDKSEAQTVVGYIRALCELPLYAGLLEGEPTSERVRLRVAGCSIEIGVRVANYRAVRSYTVVGAVLDEVAFWRSDEAGSANPDTEVLRALRPSMATVPGSMLFKVSSPFARSGVLWRDYREHYGKLGRHLVWKAPTLRMHPDESTLSVEIERAYRDDPVAAASEYGAEFRTDLAGLLSEDVLERVMEPRGDLEPVEGISYRGFIDVSGGSADAYGLGIAHWVPPEKDIAGAGRVVVDLAREWPAPFDPDEVTGEVCEILKAYWINEVTGDHYGGVWPQERFWKRGIAYEVSKDDKSRLFLHFAAMANARRASLPDHARLRAQLLSLERRTWGSGRETVDHPRGGHDDLANVAAGAAVIADRRPVAFRVVEKPPATLQELRTQAFWKDVRKSLKANAHRRGSSSGGMGIL